MSASSHHRTAPLVLLALTVGAVLIHGYHPYSEDGGIYLSGVEYLLDRHLFPAFTVFVTEHLRFSLFAPLVALLIRTTHIPLPFFVCALYLLSIGLTLHTAWHLAARLVPTRAARWGAVTLLACWLTLPIAGTSLILFDPYLTARSLTLPLSLAALVFALESNLPLCAAALLAAAVLHPLMAGYALGAVLLLLAFRQPTPARRNAILAAVVTATLLIAATLQALAPPESPDYLQVVLSRYYWFPLWWHPYEQLGLIAPLLLLAAFLRASTATPNTKAIARSAIALGLLASAVALLFARVHLATHLVARLQPLRAFALIYTLMVLLLGAWLGEKLHKNQKLLWLALFLPALMFYVQRQTYPASPHLELPWRTPTNPWVQAFQWASRNTPTDALFALDPHYITRDGEDAQLFRPIAQRSALPDYSKDGGEAAITPSLTPAWAEAQAAQRNLNTASDPERQRRLQPLGVTWLVLGSTAPTQLTCPYTNPAVKLCRLP